MTTFALGSVHILNSVAYMHIVRRVSHQWYVTFSARSLSLSLSFRRLLRQARNVSARIRFRGVSIYEVTFVVSSRRVYFGNLLFVRKAQSDLVVQEPIFRPLE